MLISEEQKSTFKEAKALNDSTSDPETNPFKSKYEGRTLLLNLRDEVHKQREDDESVELKHVEATLEYHLGVNYVYTEEVSGGEERLKRVLELINEAEYLEPPIVSVMLATYNELGVLWSSREGGIEKAHEYLSQAKSIYTKYKDAGDHSPLTVHNKFIEFSEVEQQEMFESLYTHTLYFLAQALKTLGQVDESVAHIMQTLRRQLESQVYVAEEWAIHCAGLSQYFICKDMYWEARHCLSCSQYVIEEALSKTEDEEGKNKLNEKKADIFRCWLKYCRSLLDDSKAKVQDKIGEIDEALVQLAIEGSSNSEEEEYKSTFEAFPLEATSYENQVPYQYVATFEKAKQLYLKGNDFANFALEQFKLDGFVTDHIEINQDVSRLYQNIAFFEPSNELKCRMHKRRINLLEPLLNELNAQYYLAICRQLQFELAEIHSDMMDLKYTIAKETGNRQNKHSVKKINTLCQSSLKYYGEFLTTLKARDGTYPKRFEETEERPALVAHFCSARLNSKMIPYNNDERRSYLRRSFENYSFVVNYVDNNEEAEKCVKQEVAICRDFVKLLPSTSNF